MLVPIPETTNPVSVHRFPLARVFSRGCHAPRCYRRVTPEWEAKGWVELLQKHGFLEARVYLPPEIGTPAGSIRPFLDVERVLIKDFKPSLNRSRR